MIYMCACMFMLLHIEEWSLPACIDGMNSSSFTIAYYNALVGNVFISFQVTMRARYEGIGVTGALSKLELMCS